MPLFDAQRIRSFLAQLKRRKVYHVGMTYAMVAWMLIDATSTIIPELNLPDWTVTLITLLALCGFPIALLLAWAYELTPHGIERDPGGDGPSLELPSGVEAAEASGKRSTLSQVVLLITLLIVIVGGWLTVKVVFTSQPAPDRPTADASTTAGPSLLPVEDGQASRSRTVAILPLKHISPTPEEDRYLADGITEALTSTLMRLEQFRVIAPTSVMQYRDGADRPLRQIGRELNAGTIIEGSVRMADPEFRLTLRVTDVARRRTDILLTANQTLHLDRLLSTQEQLARRAVQAFTKNVGVEAPGLADVETASTADRDLDLDAYKQYLRGLYSDARQSWNRRTLDDVRDSIDLFQRATDNDPQFARAYAGLADAYIILGYLGGMKPSQAYPKAQGAAEHALAIDSSLAEAHNALAYARYAHDWDFERAEQGFQRALELNRSYATGHHWYGWFLMVMGRHGAAEQHLREAARLDPKSLMIRVSQAWGHYYRGRYEKAVEIYQRVLNEDAQYPMALHGLGLAYTQLGQNDKAVDTLRRATGLDTESAAARAALGYAEARAGRLRDARQRLDQLQSRAERSYVPAVALAQLHLALNQPDRAIEHLRRAVENRSEYALTLRMDPVFAPLRDDPRFQKLLNALPMPAEDAVADQEADT